MKYNVDDMIFYDAYRKIALSEVRVLIDGKEVQSMDGATPLASALFSTKSFAGPRSKQFFISAKQFLPSSSTFQFRMGHDVESSSNSDALLERSSGFRCR